MADHVVVFMKGGRSGLLIRRTAEGEKVTPLIGEKDEFSLNTSFASRLRKLRVPALPYPPPPSSARRKARQPSTADGQKT